jgi:hypothetical protein
MILRKQNIDFGYLHILATVILIFWYSGYESLPCVAKLRTVATYH